MQPLDLVAVALPIAELRDTRRASDVKLKRSAAVQPDFEKHPPSSKPRGIEIRTGSRRMVERTADSIGEVKRNREEIVEIDSGPERRGRSGSRPVRQVAGLQFQFGDEHCRGEKSSEHEFQTHGG